MPSEQQPTQPKTLPFLFTPVVSSDESAERENPHVKSTTIVPDVVSGLKERFGEAVRAASVYAGEHTVLIARDRLVEVCTYLKDELGFNFLSDLGGIDRFTDEERYEIFYNLVSIENEQRLRVKIRIDESDLEAPTLTDVFRAADWNERECYDMFGIRFVGHPDLRRMYMPEDFEYHPLRKEFPLLGIPGSLPLPPQSPEAGLTMDPFPAAHGSKPVKSFDEEPGEDLSEIRSEMPSERPDDK
ncbi:MAG: NADH-quinone oxidoreductase subunit C [Rhodothermia bacterium]|nr:MAG: NADH-quinone oxidoreductase subunit C [Rhodothermia bacterium]